MREITVEAPLTNSMNPVPQFAEISLKANAADRLTPEVIVAGVVFAPSAMPAAGAALPSAPICPENVGDEATATDGVVPLPTEIFEPAVKPVRHVVHVTVATPTEVVTPTGDVPTTDVTEVAEPHALLVVIRTPPVVACTQLPEVRVVPLSVVAASVPPTVVFVPNVNVDPLVQP